MSRTQPVKIEGPSVVLDCLDPRALADFYRRLLGWRLDQDSATWVSITSPDRGRRLSFQEEPEYQPPTWPTTRSAQQMMLHLDFGVSDLEAAAAQAIALGATAMAWQPQEHVRVLADPEGHPFCLAQ